MEKISRIVGGTSRVAAVDLKNSAPVRPGTPTFGRPVGISTQVDYDPTTTAQKAVQLMNERDEKRAAQDRDTKIVQKMADSFFSQKARIMEPAKSQATIELTGAKEADDVESGDPASVENAQEPSENAPKQFTPRGSYVDVHA